MRPAHAIENIKKVIGWLVDEYGDDKNMPTFAYESKRELENALLQLEVAEGHDDTPHSEHEEL